MKIDLFSEMRKSPTRLSRHSAARHSAAALIGLACLLTLAATPVAKGQGFFSSGVTVQGKNIDLASAGRTNQYGVLATSLTVQDSTHGTDIVGDMGIGLNLTLDGAVAQGNLYLYSGGTYTTKNGGHITGTKYQDAHQGGTYDTRLYQAANDAVTLSNNISGLTRTTGTPTSITSSTTLNDTGSNHINILQLSNFQLSSGMTLTLNGTSSTRYIINVTNNFSMNNAKVVEVGTGFTAANVIFNYVNQNGNLTMDNGSVLNSILVAGSKTFTMDHASTINGELLAAANCTVNLKNGSKVIHPPIVSP